jgi:hypothetical protein
MRELTNRGLEVSRSTAITGNIVFMYLILIVKRKLKEIEFQFELQKSFNKLPTGRMKSRVDADPNDELSDKDCDERRLVSRIKTEFAFVELLSTSCRQVDVSGSVDKVSVSSGLDQSEQKNNEESDQYQKCKNHVCPQKSRFS